MSEPTPSSSSTNTTTTPPPNKRGGGSGCVGRFFSALLVVLITSSIALAAMIGAYFYLLDIPGQLGGMQQRLNQAEAQNATIMTENSLMQTQVAELHRLGSNTSESLSEIEQQQQELQSIRAELEDALRQNATVVAEAQASRDAVSVYATAEAARTETITLLLQRSERVERFLQRLSDIAGDTAQDLATATPTPTATEIPIAELTPEPSPDGDEEETLSTTPIATTETTLNETAIPSPTSTVTPTRTPSP